MFNPPIVDGRSMTIQVPGRTLSDDEDLTGTSPGLEELRWTVIVRDETACDFLGSGRPTERLVVGDESSALVPDRPTAPAWAWGAVAAGALALVAVLGPTWSAARGRGGGRLPRTVEEVLPRPGDPARPAPPDLRDAVEIDDLDEQLLPGAPSNSRRPSGSTPTLRPGPNVETMFGLNR